MGSVLWTYLLCVASFGVYALVWVYRNARQDAGRDRATAIAWALGSLATPIACAVLYQLGREARSKLEGSGGGVLPAWLAPLLHAAIGCVLFLSPLSSLWLPIWLLMPVALALVHGQLRAARRSARAALEPTVGRGRRAAEIALVVIGLPLLGFAAIRLDGSNAHILWSRSAGGVIDGVGAEYTLLVGDPGWRRVSPGTIGDPDSDLELVSEDRQSWVIVYVHGLDRTIDTIVDARRGLILSARHLQSLEERRFFLRNGDLVPVSLARYRAGESRFVQGEYVVLTARLEDSLVEVVGFTADPAGQSARLVDLVESFEAREEPAEGQL